MTDFDDARDQFRPREPMRTVKDHAAPKPAIAPFVTEPLGTYDGTERIAQIREQLGPVKPRARFSGRAIDGAASRAMAREMTADYRKRYQQHACPLGIREEIVDGIRRYVPTGRPPACEFCLREDAQ